MQLTDDKLWQQLKDEHLVTQENMPAPNIRATWYIRLLLGFSAWISALFFCVFVAFIVGEAILEEEYLSVFIGILCCSAAFLIFKSDQVTVFGSQLALVSNLCGQLLISFGLYQIVGDYTAFSFKELDRYAFILFVMQLILTFIMPNFISRVLSSWFAMTALFIFFKMNGLMSLSMALSIVLFIGVWMFDFKWKKRKALWEPIGYGLALTLISLSGNAFFYFLFDDLYRLSPQALMPMAYSYWFSNAVMFFSFCYLMNNIRLQYQISATSTVAIILAFVAVIFALLSYFVAGANAGLLLLIIGFLKQRRLLVAVGVLSLLSFVSWYYYSLQWTLLYKSLLLLVLGAVFAITLIWLNFAKRLNKIKLRQLYVFSPANLIALTTMAVILVAVDVNIYKKERILEQGQIALLKLAPVDPRSLMQGDYMRLRFSIENQLLKNRQSLSQGVFIVTLDSNNVASFKGLYKGEPLADKQIKMQFRIRDDKLLLATHAFFFQEGTAQEYESAAYGEFRVAGNGELLLNALRDKDYQLIGFYRPGN